MGSNESQNIILGFLLGIVGTIITTMVSSYYQNLNQIEERKANRILFERQLESTSDNLKLELYLNEQKMALEQLWVIMNSDISPQELKKTLQNFLKAISGIYLPEELRIKIISLMSETTDMIHDLEVHAGAREPPEMIEQYEQMLVDDEMERRRNSPPGESLDDDIAQEHRSLKIKLQHELSKYLSDISNP